MTATRSARFSHRLPPRPALADWLWAGASAGLMYGLAELAVALPGGAALPPRLAALVLAIDAALVGSCALLVGAIARWRSTRFSHSGLVGALVGPLLFAAIAGRFLGALSAGELPAILDFSGLMTAALFATGAGLAASRLADALERRGVVCSGPYVWGGVALLLAASERLAYAQRLSGWLGALIGLALMLAAAAATWSAVAVARRRESHPARPFAHGLLWLIALAAAAAAAPTWWPWLWYEREAPEIGASPGNLLIAAYPAADRSPGSGVPDATPTLERLAAEGVSFEVLPEASGAGARALLRDTRGGAVAPQLLGAGYAVAAMLPGEGAASEFARSEVDAQPGPRGLLEGRLAWLGAAPLLSGPLLPLARALGLDADRRDADALAARARAWLLDWRMERSTVPFLLFVDFRHAAPPRGRASALERSDARLGDILEHLRMLEVEDLTLVVVSTPSDARELPRAQASRAVLRAPAGWPRPAWASEGRAIGAGELGDYLIEISRSEAKAPAALPGPR